MNLYLTWILEVWVHPTLAVPDTLSTSRGADTEKNIVNLFFDSQDLTKPHLRGKQERRKRKNPLGPIVPPITPEENSVYMAHINFTNLRGKTYQSLLPKSTQPYVTLKLKK